jgi:predicted transcriptional regulator
MAEKSEKAVNYTPEQIKAMREQYAQGVSVEDIAASLNKTVRSIVAKLSHEGVYKPKEYVGKTGEKPVSKEMLADEIAKLVGLNEQDASSLAKANKQALKRVLQVLKG